MLDSVVEQRLRAALIDAAGGYLRNTVRRDRETCAVCTTPVEGGYELCYRCSQHRAYGGIADQVAAVTYAVAGSQSGYVMRGYKAPQPVRQHSAVVAILMILALSKHAPCAEILAGTPVTHWSSVPSLPAKAGEHPFHLLVRELAPGTEVKLTAASATSDPRSVSVDHFRAGAQLSSDSHALLLDDTWTGGGHVQSSALALRKAGAGKISVLVAARWIRPDYADNARFLSELPDYDPDVCPWTGGPCPRCE